MTFEQLNAIHPKRLLQDLKVQLCVLAVRSPIRLTLSFPKVLELTLAQRLALKRALEAGQEKASPTLITTLDMFQQKCREGGECLRSTAEHF